MNKASRKQSLRKWAKALALQIIVTAVLLGTLNFYYPGLIDDGFDPGFILGALVANGLLISIAISLIMLVIRAVQYKRLV